MTKGRHIKRGKPLDDDCKTANIVHEKIPFSSYLQAYCYGLQDPSTECPLQKCKECNAFVDNITT